MTMGFLAESEGADAGAADDQQTGEGGEQPVDTMNQGPDIAAPEAPRTEKVTIPTGRRGKAAAIADAVSKQIETLTKTFSESNAAYQSSLAEIKSENARLRGGFEALLPVLQQSRQQQAPAPVAPDQLKRDARKALDAGDFETWDRLNTEAILTQARALIPQQQAPQQGPSPMAMAMLYQHPAVANAGDRGIQLAVNKDNELALLGIPPSQERYKKAFELASAALSGGQQPAYSQASRGALSGVPPARSAGNGQGSGEPGVHLTDYELQVAAKCGMSKEEYARYIAEADPKRLTG